MHSHSFFPFRTRECFPVNAPRELFLNSVLVFSWAISLRFSLFFFFTKVCFVGLSHKMKFSLFFLLFSLSVFNSASFYIL